MFLIGDIIFYPVFGAGYVLNIEDRIIQGEIKKYYIISFANGMEAMIPVYSSEASRIRRAISSDECTHIMDILRCRGEVLPDKWNLRNHYYNDSIRNGDIYRLALVLSSIGDLSKKKELSKSEERIFQSILDLIAGEMALSSSKDLIDVKENILKALRSKDCKC
jgi:CarD family transcriptional regulator